MFNCTGNKNEKVEEYLSALKELLQNTKGFLGSYLAGSYPYGYYMDGSSDVDVAVIFDTDDFEEQKSIIENHGKSFDLETDINCFSKRDIFENATSNSVRETIWAMKIANALLCGEDVLADFALPSSDVFAQITATKTIDHMKDLREKCLLFSSFNYLDIDEDLKHFITIRNGKPNLKQLVITVTWIASTMLARDYSIFTASKNVTVAEYRKRYADGEEMFEVLNDCKVKWLYAVPMNENDLKQLKKHCDYVRNKEIQLLKEFNIENMDHLINY